MTAALMSTLWFCPALAVGAAVSRMRTVTVSVAIRPPASVTVSSISTSGAAPAGASGAVKVGAAAAAPSGPAVTAARRSGAAVRVSRAQPSTTCDSSTHCTQP